MIIAYTEVLRPVGTHRRYVYPLPFDEGGSTKAGEFSFDARIGGADAGTKVRSLGYDVDVAVKDGAPQATFSKTDFTPTGDLVLDYALPAKEAGLSAVTYKAEADSTGRANDDAATDERIGRRPPRRPPAPPATSSSPPPRPPVRAIRRQDVLFVVDSSYSSSAGALQWRSKLVRSWSADGPSRPPGAGLRQLHRAVALVQEPTATRRVAASGRIGPARRPTSARRSPRRRASVAAEATQAHATPGSCTSATASPQQADRRRPAGGRR